MAKMLNDTFGDPSNPMPFDASDAMSDYVLNPNQISCFVTASDANISGFQSLKIAGEPNHYDVPPGWGVIGTYVARKCHRRGIGKALFERTISEAHRAKLTYVDATIFKSNMAGLAYYTAMGFRPYAEIEKATRMRLEVHNITIQNPS